MNCFKVVRNSNDQGSIGGVEIKCNSETSGRGLTTKLTTMTVAVTTAKTKDIPTKTNNTANSTAAA